MSESAARAGRPVLLRPLCALVATALLLSACGGGGGSRDRGERQVTVSGVVQKGPFMQMRVQAFPFTPGQGVGEPMPVDVQDGGRFSFQAPSGQPVLIEASGQFIDETTGEQVELASPITALTLADGQPQNVNLFTDFASQMLQGSLQDGMPLATQIKQGERQVMQAVGLPPEQDPGRLDLNALPAGASLDDPALQLLLVSGAVMQLPREAGRMPAGLDAIKAALKQGVPPEQVLDVFAGMDARYLLELMHQAGVISNLPSVELIEQHTVWLCDPLCGWFQPPGPTLSVAGMTLFESEARAQITVRRNGASLLPLTATLDATAGTALAGFDFVDGSYPVVFANGERETRVTVPVLIDARDEGAEYFTVTLRDPSQEVALAQSSARVTLTDGVPFGSGAVADSPLSLVAGCFIGVDTPVADLDVLACSEALPPLIGFVADRPVVMALALGLQDDCDGCAAAGRDWHIALTLLAEDGDGEERARTPLGDYLYPAEQVLAASQSVSPVATLQASLQGDALTPFLLDAWRAGWQVRLLASVAGRESVAADVDMPLPLPLPDDIRFGDQSLALVGGAQFLFPPGSNGCANPEHYAVDGHYLYSVSVGGQTLDGELSGPVCVEIDDEGDGLALVVSEGEIDLSQAPLPLPRWHRALLEIDVANLFATTPQPPNWMRMGQAAELLLPGYNGQGAPLRMLLHAEHLPFAYRITGAALTAQGIRVDYDQVVSLNAPVLSPNDPRATGGMPSNAAPFSQGGAGALWLYADGLHSDTALSAGSGPTGWPAGQLSWQPFTVPVRGGRLQDTDIALSFVLPQNADCVEADCLRRAVREYRVSGTARSDRDGTLHARVAVGNQSDSPAWGARADGFAWARPQDLQAGDSATLLLPGVVMPDNAPAVHHLMAHRRAAPLSHQRFLPETDAYRQGNFAAPGITVGPETYASNTGQPVVGEGESLAGQPLRLDIGPDALSLDGHLASKYVIRNAGITGVFNADPAVLGDSIALYGYPFAFDRFAVRMTDNVPDAYNWVDGGIALPGQAGFDVQFANLDISCSGRFGQARLAAEQCGAGCALAGWRAATRLFDLAFTHPDGSASAQCVAADQRLTLRQEADFAALNKPLLLDITWQGDGTPLRSAVLPQDQYRLDARGDDAGFPVAVTGGTLPPPLPVSGPSQDYGVLLLEGRVALPFWHSLQAELRVANRWQGNLPVAESSVILPPGSLLGDTPAVSGSRARQTNDALLADIAEDSALDLQARYEWGNTGFGFGLPVYYAAPDSLSAVAQFNGRRWEQDLFVLEAGAGIDFIQPQRTKLSFGASADFTRLKNLRFQVDLTDPDGLEKVDQLLVSAGLIRQPVIAPTLGGISRQLRRVNELASRGLDKAMEKALLEAITRLGEAAAPLTPDQQDPVQTLADGLAEVRSFPEQLLQRLDDQLFDPLDDELVHREQALRAELERVEAQLLALGAGQSPSAPLISAVDTAHALADTARARIETLFVPTDAAVSEARALLQKVEAPLDRVDRARGEVMAVLERATDVLESQCMAGSGLGSEASGYLGTALGHVADLRAVVNLLQGSEVLPLLVNLVAADPAVRDGLAQAQRDISAAAEQIGTRLDSAEQTLRSNLCGSGAGQVLTDAQALMTDIGTQVATVRAGLNTVSIQLDNFASLLSAAEQTLLAPLADVKQILTDLKTQLADGPADKPGALILAELETNLQRLSNNRIDVLVADSASETDVFRFAFTPLRQTLQQRRNLVRSELRGLLDERLPLANLSADQMRRHLVSLVMASPPVTQLRTAVNRELVEVNRKVNEVALQLTDQANLAVRTALSTVENEVNAVLADASATVRGLPLDSAGLDGYGVIAGEELERAHIGAEWTMGPATDGEPGNTFGAALDAVSWSASDKSAVCGGSDTESRLDVTISAMNIPATIGTSTITMKKIYLGFTLEGGSGVYALTPRGVFGGLATQGDIGFTEFVIYDPAFAAGIGDREVYIGAAAGAVFSDIQAEVAFLVGRTCNQDVLISLDPQVAQFIPLPPSGFAGAYVRGAASIPVWTSGCPLTIGAAADIGAWLLAGPPLTLGGLVGGGAYGKVGCIGALRGQIRALGQINTDGDFTFVGEGFGVAGVGACEPAGWTSVERSRKDSWCATADARFQAGYVNGWSILDLSVSAVH